MNRLVRMALRNGWRRGILAGSSPWLVAGGVALGIRVVQRMAGAREQVVFSEELRPGETLVVAHGRPAG